MVWLGRNWRWERKIKIMAMNVQRCRGWVAAAQGMVEF
jgi:hypothetical protein